MFTPTTKITRLAFIALFGLVLGCASQAAWSADAVPPGPNAARTNFYSSQALQDNSTALLDAIDKDSPVNVQGTRDIPALTDPAVTQSDEIVERIDRISPPVISGTSDDPRYQIDSSHTEDNVDVIDALNAGQPVR